MANNTIGPIPDDEIVESMELNDKGSGQLDNKLIRTMADDADTISAATKAVNQKNKRFTASADGIKEQLEALAEKLESADLSAQKDDQE